MDPNGQETKPAKPNFFWPNVETIEGATWASRQGFGAAIFVAVATTIVSLLGIGGNAVAKAWNMSAWSLVDAGCFYAIAAGLWRHSRVAAIGGMSLYLLEQGYTFTKLGRTGSPIIIAIVLIAFLDGVRGTWARRRLMDEAAAQDPQRMAA